MEAVRNIVLQSRDLDPRRVGSTGHHRPVVRQRVRTGRPAVLVAYDRRSAVAGRWAPRQLDLPVPLVRNKCPRGAWSLNNRGRAVVVLDRDLTARTADLRPLGAAERDREGLVALAIGVVPDGDPDLLRGRAGREAQGPVLRRVVLDRGRAAVRGCIRHCHRLVRRRHQRHPHDGGAVAFAHRHVGHGQRGRGGRVHGRRRRCGLGAPARRVHRTDLEPVVGPVRERAHRDLGRTRTARHRRPDGRKRARTPGVPVLVAHDRCAPVARGRGPEQPHLAVARVGPQAPGRRRRIHCGRAVVVVEDGDPSRPVTDRGVLGIAQDDREDLGVLVFGVIGD